MSTFSKSIDEEKLFKYLEHLEQRISNIETKLELTHSSKLEIDITEDEVVPKKHKRNEEELEYEIGQFWFAKIGIVVLIIGIAFLLTLPLHSFPTFVPPLFGIILSSGFLGLAFYLKKNFSLLSGYLISGGMILVYFSALRFYFFSETPTIESLTIEIILLVIVSFGNIFVSLKEKSMFLMSIALTGSYLSVLLSNNTYLIFILLSVLSVFSVMLQRKYEWNSVLIFSIVLTYITHSLWFLNNPFTGNEIATVTGFSGNILFLLIYFSIFAGGMIYRKNNRPENSTVIFANLINVGGSYSLFLIISLLQEPAGLSFYHLLASIIFLATGIIFWKKEKSIYSTFIFAISGYMALSVAIITKFPLPDFFIYLCWQSLLVVSTAVWFRSKIIIMANFGIYLSVIIAYLSMAGSINMVSLSFGIVALVSARILNWQKDKLEIKTESLRNAYLLIALVIIPYALYNIMPSNFVSISWMIVALLYYMLSVMLKNRKYRWMAILTLMITLLYVFILGITSENSTYKILSFILLGVVLIFTSVYYSKMKTKLQKK